MPQFAVQLPTPGRGKLHDVSGMSVSLCDNCVSLSLVLTEKNPVTMPWADPGLAYLQPNVCPASLFFLGAFGLEKAVLRLGPWSGAEETLGIERLLLAPQVINRAADLGLQHRQRLLLAALAFLTLQPFLGLGHGP